MRLIESDVTGAFVVELALHHDERGAFARTYCRKAFAEAGIDFVPLQCNISRNPRAGTLRGMHYQMAPHGEAKLVQCVRGRIFDVAVDLRSDSPSFGNWAGLELSADGDQLFYIPSGCAHGFLTLEPETDVLYYMGAPFVPGAGAGVRWDDPAFAVAWPAKPLVISERDATYPDFGGDAGGAA